MYMGKEVFCPKCDSTAVEIRDVTPPKIDRVSMDDLPGLGACMSMPAIMQYRRKLARCQHCGHEKQWTET